MEIRYQTGETIQIERDGDFYRVTIGAAVYRVSVLRYQAGELAFAILNDDASSKNGDLPTPITAHTAHVARDGQTHYVGLGSAVYALTRAQELRRRAAQSGHDSLDAKMDGKIVGVLVTEGERVTRGQPLIVMEAMKMESRIVAPHDGHVSRILCQPGQVVARGQSLLELSE